MESISVCNMANWIVYGSADGSSDQPDFSDALNTTTRRHHSKSRKGCTVCKQRRIKCDETLPACRQCVDYGRTCSFLTSPTPSHTTSTEPSFDDLVDQVWAKLQPTPDVSLDFTVQKPQLRTILDHFLTCEEDWLAGAPFQSLIQQHGITIGLQSTYLLHAIVAVSADHLYVTKQQDEDLHVIGQFHDAVSLRLYQEKLQDIHAEDLDPIYACGILQIIMTLRCTLVDMLEGEDLWDGFEMLLAAIKTMRIFPALAEPFEDKTHKVPSIFRALFERSNFPAHINLGDEALAPIASSIAPLEALVRYVTGDDVFDRVYMEPFAYLIRISKRDSQSQFLETDMAFSSQLKDHYLEALQSRDPVAILLLCYWFALLSRIKQWWIHDPAPPGGNGLLHGFGFHPTR